MQVIAGAEQPHYTRNPHMSNPQIIGAPLATISPVEIPQTHLAPHLEASTSRPILTVEGG